MGRILVPEFEPKLLDRITGRYHPYFNDEEADRVKYLSISRSYTAVNQNLNFILGPWHGIFWDYPFWTKIYPGLRGQMLPLTLINFCLVI